MIIKDKPRIFYRLGSEGFQVLNEVHDVPVDVAMHWVQVVVPEDQLLANIKGLSMVVAKLNIKSP